MAFGARGIAEQRFKPARVPPTTPRHLAVAQEEQNDIEWAEGLWEKGLSITAVAAETGLPRQQLESILMPIRIPNDGH